jgi:hypothetical protein
MSNTYHDDTYTTVYHYQYIYKQDRGFNIKLKRSLKAELLKYNNA